MSKSLLFYQKVLRFVQTNLTWYGTFRLMPFISNDQAIPKMLLTSKRPKMTIFILLTRLSLNPWYTRYLGKFVQWVFSRLEKASEYLWGGRSSDFPKANPAHCWCNDFPFESNQCFVRTSRWSWSESERTTDRNAEEVHLCIRCGSDTFYASFLWEKKNFTVVLIHFFTKGLFPWYCKICLSLSQSFGLIK